MLYMLALESAEITKRAPTAGTNTATSLVPGTDAIVTLPCIHEPRHVTPCDAIPRQSAREHRIGQDKTREERTGEDRIGQDRTGEERTGEVRRGEDRTGHQRSPTHTSGTRRYWPDSVRSKTRRRGDGGEASFVFTPSAKHRIIPACSDALTIARTRKRESGNGNTTERHETFREGVCGRERMWREAETRREIEKHAVDEQREALEPRPLSNRVLHSPSTLCMKLSNMCSCSGALVSTATASPPTTADASTRPCASAGSSTLKLSFSSLFAHTNTSVMRDQQAGARTVASSAWRCCTDEKRWKREWDTARGRCFGSMIQRFGATFSVAVLQARATTAMVKRGNSNSEGESR